MIYKTIEELNALPDNFWSEPGQVLKVNKKEHLEFLNIPTQEITAELGEKIAAKLIITLNKINRFKRKGLALTANQIGINASVFVISSTSMLYFINPKITETSSKTITFNESCLSIPHKKCAVKRHVRIKIEADNLTAPTWFGIDVSSEKLIFSDPYIYSQLLEAIAIQHEFNHTQGILITDIEEKLQPIIVEHKLGRNDKIEIIKGNEIKTIKYKYYDQYVIDGWQQIYNEAT